MSQSASDVTPAHGLTDMQLRFADMWAEALASGVKFTNQDIAKAAGYSGDDEGLRVAASRTLHNPKVREYLHGKAKHYLRQQAFPAAVTLAKLMDDKSARVRADIATRLATGLGLIEGERGADGPAVAVQIVFRTEAGALLVHGADHRPQAQVISHVADVEDCLAEAAPAPDAPLPSEPGGEVQPSPTPKRGGGSKTRARRSPPGPSHNSPPEKSRPAKKSPAKKSRKGGGKARGKALRAVSASRGGGGAAAVVKAPVEASVRKGRVLQLSDEERARRSEAARARNLARWGKADG